MQAISFPPSSAVWSSHGSLADGQPARMIVCIAGCRDMRMLLCGCCGTEVQVVMESLEAYRAD